MSTSPLVIDASVLVALLLPAPDDADDGGLADALRDPSLEILAPPVIDLEVLNVGAHRRRIGERHLVDLARLLEGLPIGRYEPRLEAVARWAGRGLAAYDAAYAAVAVEVDAPLLTHDSALLELLPGRAVRSFSP